jgi:CDP-diacylglycerol--glycerol-3-phosphate 3-phosphatidyltransferase
MSPDTIDLGCSVGLATLTLFVAVAYARRVTRAGVARHARVDQAGGSPLLGKGLMEMGYWAMRPVAQGCMALGMTASSISWASLVLAAAAGASLGFGHYGIGAALSLASSACDALDGMVARETHTASAAGEVLDATVDRYSELFFFGGVAFHERNDGLVVLLTFAATAGAVMVSYASAKGEAFRVQAPRGAMRRQERAVYLALGAALVPITAASSGRTPWLAHLPLLGVLALVAVVGNVSAVGRLRAIARAVAGPKGLYEPDASHGVARDAHAAAGDALR